MTREEHYQKIQALSDAHKYIMLRLPTSFGKSKVAIDLISNNLGHTDKNVLIVVPRLVLMDNWRAELEKWNFPKEIQVTLTTYVSFPKHADKFWDYILIDECHHFTENCAEAVESFKYDRVIAMSATIPKEARWRLQDSFPGIKAYSVTARDAIDDKILPDPKVILIPMMLENKSIDEVIVKQKSKPGPVVTVSWSERFSVRLIKNRPIHIRCTAQQWYDYISELVEWWKQQYMASQQVYQKNNWLRLAKERLNFCAEKKEPFVKKLLEVLSDKRVLTFCTSIAQTEALGEYCINSKSKKLSLEYLKQFNEGEISQITACGMLNEGMNLLNCQVGIYANIGSSEIVEVQRLGRILRHQNPLIIIPYYVATREEEIVAKMLKNYNPDFIKRLYQSEVTADRINEILQEEEYGTTEDND